jgi:hypothetical protein
LLELGEMRCAHVSMVAADLYRAAGYQARLVQLGAHICAEVYYDGGWHYLDADLYGGDQIARLPNGTIPSVDQLSRQPQLLNAVFSTEPNLSVTLPTLAYYMAYFYFSTAAYSGPPGYYVKNTTVAQDATSADYGWKQMVFVQDSNRVLWSGLPEYAPAAPKLNTISITDDGDGTRQVTLTWLGKTPVATDPNNSQLNIKEYDVFIGTQSRGWNYSSTTSMNLPITFKSSTQAWSPDDYDLYYQLPPADQVLEVTSTQATFNLPNDQDFYISVMPVDWYGSRIGRQLFHLSEETVIRATADTPPAA